MAMAMKKRIIAVMMAGVMLLSAGMVLSGCNVVTETFSSFGSGGKIKTDGEYILASPEKIRKKLNQGHDVFNISKLEQPKEDGAYWNEKTVQKDKIECYVSINPHNGRVREVSLSKEFRVLRTGLTDEDIAFIMDVYDIMADVFIPEEETKQAVLKQLIPNGTIEKNPEKMRTYSATYNKMCYTLSTTNYKFLLTVDGENKPKD